MDNLLG
jgi:hypothetical protein